MDAKIGDFVTATVDLTEPHPIRQGIYIGNNLILGESGSLYRVIEIHAIVESLLGSTLRFVQNWRKRNS